MKAFGNIFYESLTSVSVTVNFQMRNNGKCDFLFYFEKRLYFQDQDDLKSTFWKSENEYVKLS